MEDRLRALVEASSEANRNRWALEAKRQGKLVVGWLCSYVPEEVLYAASIMPYRIIGSSNAATPQAAIYRMPNTCLYCTHVLESLLTGGLDFLDGVVGTDRDQELIRLRDAWLSLNKSRFIPIVHVPHTSSDLGINYFAGEIKKFIKATEEFAGSRISQMALYHAIKTYNRTRSLLSQLYELRKRESPPISGTEALGITLAATVMPKDFFNEELEALLPYLESRKTNLPQAHPRVLVSSDLLDNLEYLRIVEEVGCVVAMDDLDTGSRYFWHPVDDAQDDLPHSLAKRYLTRPQSPQMYSWDKQAQQVINWYREYRIDGVVELPQLYNWPRVMRMPFFKRSLKEAGIPLISLERHYHLANIGQFKTRIQAFLEMVDKNI